MSGYEIHPIALPTPFPVGNVNVYLLRGDRCVLIDTGLDWGKDRAALVAGLAAAGIEPKQVAEVLLTHAHIDHAGQAGWIQEVSGAPVRAHAADAPRVTGHPAAHAAMMARYRDYSSPMGFPLELYDRMAGAYAMAMTLMRAARIERPLADGERIPLGAAELEVVHTPGHTPGSVCFWDAGSRVLFAGDTVLEKITPNPFFGGHSHRSTMGAASYLRSLDRLLSLGVGLVHCGHGEPVRDLADTVAKVRHHHQLRAEKILSLAEGPPVTAYELSRRLFGDLPLAEVWLAFAETLGHLEVLEDAGRVRPVEVAGSIRFERT